MAGATVTSTSGAPGSAPAIRLRGSTSLTGRQDPLVIIDGTITRISLADINSEDIDRIEVIKGAAASSLYGSDAANGVIQIFTKSGRQLSDGRTEITFRNEFGVNEIRRTIPNNNSHAFQLNPDGSFMGYVKWYGENRVLLVAHGGISTLGANAVSMAIGGPLIAYYLFWLPLKGRTPTWLSVFVTAFMADLATYFITTSQLALAFPDPVSGFWGSWLTFAAIFAVTQIPLAVAEGILVVLIFNALQSTASRELKELGLEGV